MFILELKGQHLHLTSLNSKRRKPTGTGPETIPIHQDYDVYTELQTQALLRHNSKTMKWRDSTNGKEQAKVQNPTIKSQRKMTGQNMEREKT